MRNLILGVIAGMMLTLVGYAGAAVVSYIQTTDERERCESTGTVYIHEVRGCVAKYDDGMIVT